MKSQFYSPIHDFITTKHTKILTTEDTEKEKSSHRHLREVIWRTRCELLCKRATSLIDEAYPIP